MAHEIETHDGIVLHKQKAWHGLGTIVQDAPTPRKALEIAGLDWPVEQWPAKAVGPNGQEIVIPGAVMNVRADISHGFGFVTDNYSPIQNSELADFCQLLAEQGDEVRIESAGSIRNGAKVWFLLKGESFSVRKKDEISPYILVSNGHDGATSLRCTPTTVRVVCSNTLHLVIPRTERGKVKAKPASFVANHLGDIKSKVEDAKQALGLYRESLVSTKGMIDEAAAKDINQDFVKRFFLECYVRDFGAIPVDPKTAHEEQAKTKAKNAFAEYEKRFQDERKLAGTTAWNAFNAYTGWSQNDRTFWKDPSKEAERRIHSKLFGADTDRATATLIVALSL